jgi:hypothetical protein
MDATESNELRIDNEATLAVLRAERRYNVFKTVVLTIVMVLASSAVVWQVNKKVNQSHELVRCEAQAIYNATDTQTFRTGLKNCLDKDVDKSNKEL